MLFKERLLLEWWLALTWGLDREIEVRRIMRGTAPGGGVKLRELWWGPAGPGLQFKGQVPVLQASAKQLGRCPADLTPPQGRNCRVLVTGAAQIEVSSPESRCSPIFCMRWCRVGLQPVDKWLRFRLQFGSAKTLMCSCLSVCVRERESEYAFMDNCRYSVLVLEWCSVFWLPTMEWQNVFLWEKLLTKVIHPSNNSPVNLNKVKKLHHFCYKLAKPFSCQTLKKQVELNIHPLFNV